MQQIVQISRENETLLTSLHTFYGFPSSDTTSENMQIILPYLNGSVKIAIRYIDWFVTNYAKKHHVTYDKLNSITNTNESYDVYSDYRGLLKGYKKHTFDPYCREDKDVAKIPFKYAKDKFILTTFGQLNFYKWAIQNDVLKYIENNYDAIKNDLEETLERKKSEDKDRRDCVLMNMDKDKSQSQSLTLTSSTEKKRKELSESSYKTMHVNKTGGCIVLSI